MDYARHQHSYSDDELCSGALFAKQMGVSGAAVSKATSKGRLDTFRNSRGEKCYHKVLSAQQWTLKKDRSKVTTPTRGQIAAGYDNMDAQAMAHVFGNENPQAPRPVSAPIQGMDFGSVVQERQELEVSKAEKEYHMARLAKLKADEKEGSLVDKQTVFLKGYQMGAMIQEKVMNMYVQLAPKICGHLQEQLANAGIEPEKLRLAMKDSNHEIGEIIRKESIIVLKDLSERTVDNFFD
ncbi:hypothetical protein SAMN05720766_10968 [Fibrobacter sp. UWH9]|uniref:hypothetical protein n=1 Tax=Fibrobacter sp. UWH9 TaxID=1896213 RepID=UPI000922B48E|nr:hypothetical protein [Fibrobacter sp. UWH9]SHH25471.1 hypothetical protein SAMN05720766_10968 [Fibrobacter sp. UWH9]